MRKDAGGSQAAVIIVATCSDPGGSLRGSSRSPPVPDSRGCSLAHSIPDKSCSQAHLGTAAPLLPSCHGPLPAIPPFRLSLPYVISLSPVKCYCHCYCSTSSIFLITNVILIQQIPEVPQPSCESVSVLSLETYLI